MNISSSYILLTMLSSGKFLQKCPAAGSIKGLIILHLDYLCMSLQADDTSGPLAALSARLTHPHSELL